MAVMTSPEVTPPTSPVAGTAVWVGGRVVGPAEATVSVYDHGLTVGDGVFETLKVVDGRPFALRRHLDRLERSARGLGLDVPYVRARMVAAVDDALAAAGPTPGASASPSPAASPPWGRAGARRRPPWSSPWPRPPCGSPRRPR